MTKPVLLSIDQGTTGTKVLFLDQQGHVVAESYQKHTQIYPQPGWVEHDPEEIWACILRGVEEALSKGKIDPKQVKGVGLSNQGETVLFFDAQTSKPLYPAIVWSCKRSTSIAEKWAEDADWYCRVADKTGLRIDPYYSATKIKWMMNEVPDIRESLDRSWLRCSTLDSWLIYQMTDQQSYYTDSSTASRTLLFNIRENQWDQDILDYLSIKKEWLPPVLDSIDTYGMTHPDRFCGIEAPICVNMMDQAASLYGHRCTKEGMSKCTYGTGCFIYMNTEDQIYTTSEDPIDTTVVWSRDGQLTYCLDTSVPSAGSIVEWGKDSLQLYKDIDQLQSWSLEWLEQRRSAELDHSLLLIPSFSGLGTPYWNPNVRGMFLGVTHYMGKKEFARALLEGIAYSVADCLTTIERTTKQPISVLKVDGGLTNNPYLMQFQADITGVPVHVQAMSNTTAMGLGFLVGEALNWWTTQELDKMVETKAIYTPSMDAEKREQLRKRWNAAIQGLIAYFDQQQQ